MSLVSSVVAASPSSLMLTFPPTFHTHTQIGLTGDSELPVGINVSVSGCLCVSPLMDGHCVLL